MAVWFQHHFLLVVGVFSSEASLEWRKRESCWRRAGVLLYQSEATMCVLERLEVEIEAGRLGVRKDCCVESDLGLRQRLLDMLFCYNPVWLKLGLEVCEGCLCAWGGVGVGQWSGWWPLLMAAQHSCCRGWSCN